MKTINGKAIYEPAGKAGEYARYACNFYLGCSNGCTYCYNKTGRFKNTMGGGEPTLKKCFQSEDQALEIFEKELNANLPELQKHGLFFSFTTDPLLPETKCLTYGATAICIRNNVNVKWLTKRADFVFPMLNLNPKCRLDDYAKRVAIGFTLTGRDDLEPGASPNAERIEAMKKLHDAGFKTFASIEPVINTFSSADMILQTMEFCDLYKAGILSGKEYGILLKMFVESLFKKENNKFYLKDSLLQRAGISREDLPANCVDKDYNIFSN
jgi:DNA repair photolyase